MTIDGSDSLKFSSHVDRVGCRALNFHEGPFYIHPPPPSRLTVTDDFMVLRIVGGTFPRVINANRDYFHRIFRSSVPNQ